MKSTVNITRRKNIISVTDEKTNTLIGIIRPHNYGYDAYYISHQVHDDLGCWETEEKAINAIIGNRK